MSDDRAPFWGVALARTLVLASLMAGIALLMGLDLQHLTAYQRGVESGLADDAAPLEQPRFAANVDLDRYTERQEIEAMAMLRDLGFGTIRQRIPWADIEPEPGRFEWERWDRLLSLMQNSGLRVVAVLDTSPAWARPAWEADNPFAPPAHPEAFAEMARAVALRYGETISAYQIWDRPNISPHWGTGGPVNPSAYATMLRLAASAIREVDPEAVIVSAGLAPNTEVGGRNLSDVAYLHELYRLGAADTFDVLGVLPYGFWSGPDDRRAGEAGHCPRKDQEHARNQQPGTRKPGSLSHACTPP